MPENQYLSIGEVLGLLLEDFPDVTISKIRFLESQGLIEPERTPSGYRKFYEQDVELLRTILHEQKANFLPLKVIRDRIESGAIDAEAVPRTPPRGIRNVGVPEQPKAPEQPRDSVFRRTDGGPEWAEGRPFIPGDDPVPTPPPITAAVPVTPAAPGGSPPSAPKATGPAAPAESTTAPPTTPPTTRSTSTSTSTAAPSTPSIPSTPPATIVEKSQPPIPAGSMAPTTDAPSAARTGPAKVAAASKAPTENKAAARQGAAPGSRPLGPVAASSSELPYGRDELCTAAAISEAQLTELEEFGLIVPRGTGSEATYPADALEIARVAGIFLDQGIDARHLRAWRQAAEREATLFEQRIMPLLRQRNPQSRQQALETLSELAELGSELRAALVGSLLRHHFEGG